MIVDRYHLSLSKLRPNMSLTVTMETEPIEHAQSSHADPADPAKDSFVSFLHPAYNSVLGVLIFLRKANVGTKSWRSIYGRTSMERAGKTTIFPGDVSLGVIFWECVYDSKINMNIVDLVEFYGCLCSLCYWKYFTEQFKGTLGS